MTIFDFLNDILYRKKGDLLNNVDHESSFNLYMINRWASMYSTDVANIINHTTNKYYSIFETKHESYNFLVKILPKVKFRRIHYIKKKSKEKSADAEVIKQLASHLELSQREIIYYITTNKINLENYKKCLATKG